MSKDYIIIDFYLTSEHNTSYANVKIYFYIPLDTVLFFGLIYLNRIIPKWCEVTMGKKINKIQRMCEAIEIYQYTFLRLSSLSLFIKVNHYSSWSSPT
jgi:hypothetical protein